ncbi:hypothetical protein Tco_1286625, partial [Tanacetum coccineum]
MSDKEKVLSDDPFNLYDNLNKRKNSGDDLKYPPGFTPSVINVEEVNEKEKGATSNEVNEHVNSTSNKLEEFVPKGKVSSNNSVCSKRIHSGGSILQFMDKRNNQEELFLQKEMDLETAQTNAAAKLPLLKQENGNSFKPTARTTTNADGTSTSMIPGHITIEEKAQKKNDVKARSMLLMALPNEHQ